MKPSSIIFPVIALAIAGAWLGIQHRAISSLEQARGHLEKTIASRASDSIADSQSGKPPISSKAANDKEPLDWKKLGALFVKMQDGADMTDILDHTKARQRFMAMSKEELVAALDEITAADIPKGSRDVLEQLILGSLIEKDPEFVLTKYIGRIPADGTFGPVFSYALEKWAEKDLTAACNWYDQQNAAGAFDSKSLDGKNDTRLQIEGNLINLLLATDPVAAARRLAALPEDQRARALLRPDRRRAPKQEHQAAFAKLVRDQLPQNEQGEIFAQCASYIVWKDGGYVEGTAFLNRIQATPTERTACVELAAEGNLNLLSSRRKTTREDFNAMREWVTTQAPDSTDSVTGRALANAITDSDGIGKMAFSEAAELALEYHNAAGNDKVLVSFLDSRNVQLNKEQARILAEKISDPARREEILKKLQ